VKIRLVEPIIADLPMSVPDSAKVMLVEPDPNRLARPEPEIVNVRLVAPIMCAEPVRTPAVAKVSVVEPVIWPDRIVNVARLGSWLGSGGMNRGRKTPPRMADYPISSKTI
jgi:hypothetical protein